MVRGKIFLAMLMIVVLIMPTALAYEELAKGAKGDDVVELQEQLNQLGYSVGNADGDFGQKTYDAVMRFQQENGLSPSGVADEATQEAIYAKANDSQTASSSVEEVDVTLENDVKCVYDAIGDFSEGLAVVCKDNKFGYINETGELVIPCQFDLAFNFSEGYARVYDYSNHIFGYIDQTGEKTIFSRWENAGDFHDGRAIVSTNNSYGFIDSEGNQVIPCSFSYAEDFSCGMAVVQEDEDGKFGFINKEGTVVIPCQYDRVSCFGNAGYAWAQKDGLWGVIDINGSIVMPFQWDSGVMSFGSWNGNDRAVIFYTRESFNVDMRCCLVDTNGNLLTEIEYTRPIDANRSFTAFAMTKAATGEVDVFDAEGNKLFSATGEPSFISDDVLRLENGSTVSYYDLSGEAVDLAGILPDGLYEPVQLIATEKSDGRYTYDLKDYLGNTVLENAGDLQYFSYQVHMATYVDDHSINMFAAARNDNFDVEVTFTQEGIIVEGNGISCFDGSPYLYVGSVTSDADKGTNVSVLAKAAVAELRSNLKNPDSLQVHSIVAYQAEDNLNQFYFLIDYSAMNGLGGYNRNDIYVTVYQSTGGASLVNDQEKWDIKVGRIKMRKIGPVSVAD